MDSIKAMKTDVSDIVSRSVTTTFGTMFHRAIAPASAISAPPPDKEICSLVSLTQAERLTMDFCFSFHRELLDAIARDAYSEEELRQPFIREDIACAIANIVCSSVKTFLNGRGYALDMNIPSTVTEPIVRAKDREFAQLSFSNGIGQGSAGILVNIEMQDNTPGKRG